MKVTSIKKPLPSPAAPIWSGDIDEEASAIFDLATLVGVLTAGPDADTAVDGIRLIMIQIRDRAAAIKQSVATQGA
jgi:hypothetical protein